MFSAKTARSVVRDIAYLRDAFGPCCKQLEIKNKKISEKGVKRPAQIKTNKIETNFFEHITTADISGFISAKVRRNCLSPKTANRYREILTRLFNWAAGQYGVVLPGGQNPAAKVERYKEQAPQISFLTKEQIEEQLNALENVPNLQIMVAVLLYAGLRREELCWLTVEDVDFRAGGNGMIRIRAKTVCGEKWEPKTKKNRIVPISNNLIKYLEYYKPQMIQSQWYFFTPQGKRWDPDNFSRYLRNVNRQAQLDWTCLQFRHTFGSQLAMKGESLYKISKLMGNSPEICSRHYAALTPEAMVDTVNF
ncbi:MAG TPA: site-specific integrase [Desulfuromonadaceae bacterium]|jgi:integrase